jgi:ABC-type xylose transport system permease subunit
MQTTVYGNGADLDTIAAIVVGGTSLTGDADRFTVLFWKPCWLEVSATD